MIRKKQNGITLIALIITIILLLILAGVCINLLLGEEGVIEQAKWAAYVTEYESIKEKQEIYTTDYILKQIENKNKVATLNDTIIKTQEQKLEMYPVSNKINIEDVSNSLKTTIKEMEGLADSDLTNERLVNLYKVDLNKLKTTAKKQYIINIESGELYSIEYQVYKRKLYHTPRLGVEKQSQKIEAQIDKEGTYEIVVDAGQTVSWDMLEINYVEYVENSVIINVYTSDDEINWKEEIIGGSSKTDQKEQYKLTEIDRSRFVKVKIEVKSINGNNSQIAYVLVNFYKYRETEITPEITSSGVEKNDKTYSVATSANGQTESSRNRNCYTKSNYTRK